MSTNMASGLDSAIIPEKGPLDFGAPSEFPVSPDETPLIPEYPMRSLISTISASEESAVRLSLILVSLTPLSYTVTFGAASP